MKTLQGTIQKRIAVGKFKLSLSTESNCYSGKEINLFVELWMHGNCLWGFFGEQVPPVSPSLRLEHANLNCLLEQNTHQRPQTQCSSYLPYKLILNRNSLLFWDYCLLLQKSFHLPLQLLTCNFSAHPTKKVTGSCLCERHKAGDAKTHTTNTWRKISGRLILIFNLHIQYLC